MREDMTAEVKESEIYLGEILERKSVGGEPWALIAVNRSSSLAIIFEKKATDDWDDQDITIGENIEFRITKLVPQESGSVVARAEFSRPAYEVNGFFF